MHGPCILTQHSGVPKRYPSAIHEMLSLSSTAKAVDRDCFCPSQALEMLDCGFSVPVCKFDGYQSSQRRNDSGYEVSTNRVQTANTFLFRMERRYWELRLNRAIRRFQEQIRCRIQRRCELRLFVVLRLQFVCRSRNRARAAALIQRFVRNKVLPSSAPKIQYSD
jgi:hypothetical protein